MSVRIIVGRAGTGKTALCMREIGAELIREPLGAALLWLVPEQGTFAAERLLLTSEAGKRGTFRAQVLSFRRLAVMVGRELGILGGEGEGAPLGEIGRRVMLEELVRRERTKLNVFGGSAGREGFIIHLDAMMRELRQHGHTGGSLRQMLDGAEAGAMDAVTRLKMIDLAHLLDAWENEMGRSKEWDFEQLFEQVTEKMRASKLITQGARVWVDAFSAMTALEVRMFGALGMHAREVTITLLADPDSESLQLMREMDGGGLFSRTERLYRQLMDEFRRVGVPVAGTTALREAKRFMGEGVRKVEHELFEDARKSPEAIGRKGEVELWECSEPETEVRMVAQAIKRMALESEGGMRYRQMAVIVPELGEAGAYQDAVRRIFAEHGIAHFIDERRPMGHHPAVELVRSAVSAVTSGYARDEMLLYLKTRLAGVAEGDVAELENYLWEHGITRGAWEEEWTWVAQNKREEDAGEVREAMRERLRRVNRVREKVWGDLAEFGERMTAVEDAAKYVNLLRALLVRLNVEGQVMGWMEKAREEGDAELAQVHEQAWREVEGVLEMLEKVLRGKERTVAEFSRLLGAALEQLTLGLIPPTVDQVLVSSVTRSRVPEMEAVFVLGAVEGSFPKVVEEDPILSDGQRAAFNAVAEMPIGEGSDRQLLEMPFFDYVALTRSRRQLVVSHPVADQAGRALAPSRYVRRLREVLGEALVERSFDAASRAEVERMSTVEDVMTGVAAWGREMMDKNGEATQSETVKVDAMRGVYNWVVDSKEKGIAAGREMVWEGLKPRRVAGLSEEMAGRFFPAGRAMRMSVSQLEKYAACPLQYFYHYMLRLKPREELALDVLELGSLQHNILEGLYRKIIERKLAWPEEDGAALRAELEKQVDRAIGEMHAELKARTPGYDKMRRRIIRTLGVMVEADRRRAGAGGFRPAAVELTFGQKPAATQPGKERNISLPVLTVRTPAGRMLELNGKMDRMDASEKGKLAVVIDYKSAADKRVDLNRVEAGLSVQLPVYALVAQKLAGLEPTGAFLVSLGMKREAVESPTVKSQADVPESNAGEVPDEFYQRYKPRGFANGALAGALDRSLLAEAGGTKGAGASAWYAMQFNKTDGAIRKGSDLLSGEDFGHLLAFAERKVGELADRLASGEIGPRPVKDGGVIPCETCEYRGMCAFDSGRDRVVGVGRDGRAEVLGRMKK